MTDEEVRIQVVQLIVGNIRYEDIDGLMVYSEKLFNYIKTGEGSKND